MDVSLNEIDEDISSLLDNLPVGIVRLNREGECVYANKFILNAFGLISCTDINNIRDRQIKHIHPDDLQEELQHCRRFLFENMECETTFRLYNEKYKEHRWMKNKRTLIKTGDETSYMYTFQDIHDNKLMEIQLRNETIKAERAYNHKSIFLANMSHEIRTPLNGIIGMLTLLEDTTLNTNQQDYINMIKECSFNLMTIINDILDYSKLEVGKITLDIKSMSLQDCIESTNDIVVSKIYEKALEYTYNIGIDVPNMINGDSNRIKQVLLNLLSNSIKFTESGTIFLNVETIKLQDYQLLHDTYQNESISIEQEDCLYLRFDITDTGCGIEESERHKLFKSFSQVDNQITSKIYQGTGLGLAISKELVELMNGFIWLDWSDVGKGSRFSFVIKVSSSNENLECTSDCDKILIGQNVLIVDDNLYNRISLTGMVTKWGMKPHSFSNSEEALYFTKITQFDIGLIDICMPKLDGVKFAGKLREQNEFNNRIMPLIALSSLGDKTTTSNKVFKHHLIKPIKEAKLKQVCIDSLREYINCNVGNISNTGTRSRILAEEIVNPKVKETLDTYIHNNDITNLKGDIRILLAEDVYINQKVIIGFLEKLGYKNINVVENGQQCIDYCLQNEYDIILLDIRMPILDGEAVIKRLHEHYTNPRIRKPYIVAVTAYCLREDKNKYLDMGFDNYIPKPVSITELTKCMNAFIELLLHE